ncbi:hypothetical protein ACFT9I_34555 [Streptomyces sp. NPDC057137]
MSTAPHSQVVDDLLRSLDNLDLIVPAAQPDPAADPRSSRGGV